MAHFLEQIDHLEEFLFHLSISIFIFIEQLFIKTVSETFLPKCGLERYLATSKSVQEARNTFRHSHSRQQQL